MSQNGFAFRLIGVLLLIGLVAAGGYVAYRAGVTQGIAQAPEVATAISNAAESGQPLPPMYGYRPYGFGYPHRFGFFPLGGICLSIFFLFLFFGLLKMVFYPWRHSKHAWNRKWEGNTPPMFDEWHKRAHGEQPGEGEEKRE
jgi:hypothetical protein